MTAFALAVSGLLVVVWLYLFELERPELFDQISMIAEAANRLWWHKRQILLFFYFSFDKGVYLVMFRVEDPWFCSSFCKCSNALEPFCCLSRAPVCTCLQRCGIPIIWGFFWGAPRRCNHVFEFWFSSIFSGVCLWSPFYPWLILLEFGCIQSCNFQGRYWFLVTCILLHSH